MSVLLDTHIWVWWLTPGSPLSRAEREALDEKAGRRELFLAAISLWEAQVDRITSAIARIVRRHATLARGLAIVTGLGDFLAAEASRRAGLQAAHLSAHWGRAARHAPAAAIALLLDAKLEMETIAR